MPRAAISGELTCLYEGTVDASKPGGVFGPTVRNSRLAGRARAAHNPASVARRGWRSYRAVALNELLGRPSLRHVAARVIAS
jgi:hypothetical protein